MDDAEDVQDASQSVESQTPPQKPPSPVLEDDPEPQNNVENAIIVEDIVESLPEGCPNTPMHVNSYKYLREAREAATTNPEIQYSTLFTRLRMRTQLSRVGRGMKPRFYQEDCAEAFVLGLNTGLICATGSGKTEAFVLPLFADPDKKSKIIIISPLNALQEDHAQRFRKYGISAAAVNGQTYSDKLHTSLEKGRIRAVITSPEMVFKHARFSKLLRNAKWMSSVLGIVLDEVHCVLEWGKEFRKDFDKVDDTRTYMASKPLFWCTATLTPSMFDDLLEKLSFPKQRFIINLGCERHNVLPIVCRLKGPSDFEALDFVLKEAFEDPPQALIPTLIYADERETVLAMWLHLVGKLPRDSPYRGQVEFMMATRDPIVKAIVMARFLCGKVRVMCSTEATGLGIDARVRRVVQFGCPRNLLQWQQHAGRAGRDGEPAYALLLVEPSVFQVVVRKEPKKPAKGKGKAKAAQKGSKKTKQSTSQVNEQAVDEPVEEEEADEEQPADEEASTQSQPQTKVQDATIKQEDSEVILSPQLKRKRLLEDLAEEDVPEDQAPDNHEALQIPERADPPAGEVTDHVAAQEASLEGTTIEYRKHVDEDMRELCMTEKCRREVTMKAFNSPPPFREMNVSCCDNCLLSRGESAANPLTVSVSAHEEFDTIILKLIDECEERLMKKPKPPKVVIPMPSADPDAKPIKNRVKDRYNNVKSALETLRYTFWRENYGNTMFTAASVLPDAILNALASQARITTMADLGVALPNWDFAEEMGQAALETIAEADAKWIAKNEAEKAERAAKRRKESAENKIKRDEERLIAKREETAKRKSQEHAEAVQNWNTYRPSATAPTTPVRAMTPAHPYPTPPQVPLSYTSPTTPTYGGHGHPLYPAYALSPRPMPPPTLVPPQSPVPLTPSSQMHAPPFPFVPLPHYGTYYPYPHFMATQHTPVRVPSAPVAYMYPTPPFTPVASTSRLPPPGSQNRNT